MVNQQQDRIRGWSLRDGRLALTIVYALTLVVSSATQAQTFKVIHNFSGGQDGASPYAGLTLDKVGNLYGTAYAGGIGYGTVYQLKPKGANWIFNPLFSFDGSDGAYPEARVVFGANGTLFGTTSAGGPDAGGVVYSLRPQARACATTICPWNETLLHSFTGGGTGGWLPEFGDLLFDQAGNIYGTTYYGGNTGYNNGYGAGVVFQLTPPGIWNTENVLYAFSISDGEFPTNGVTFDNAGNLYGTTSFAGLDASGTVFELMYPGWAQQCTLSNFPNGNDGSYPLAGLVFDQSGNLYGTTSDGGKNENGTIFQLVYSAPCTWTLNTIYSFTGPTGGCGPRGTLVLDSAGNIYGATACAGAHGFGNIFKLTHNTWAYTSLYDFNGGNDGAYPTGQVILDSKGDLYGTTRAGGTQNVGVAWEITFP